VTCPETERLIVFGLGKSDDPELEAHVQTCDDCQADLLTISVLGGAGRKEEVSEALISSLEDQIGGRAFIFFWRDCSGS